MKEKIDFNELENSLNKIKNIIDNVKNNLTSMDELINENINNGSGILDGNSGELFIQKWEKIKEDIPSSINEIESQANNLETFINTMKNED